MDERSTHRRVAYTSNGDRCTTTPGHRGERLTEDEALAYCRERRPLWTDIGVIG